MEYKQVISYITFAVLGAGIMYGVWLHADNSRLTKELRETQLENSTLQTSYMDAQAEVLRLKK